MIFNIEQFRKEQQAPGAGGTGGGDIYTGDIYQHGGQSSWDKAMEQLGFIGSIVDWIGGSYQQAQSNQDAIKMLQAEIGALDVDYQQVGKESSKQVTNLWESVSNELGKITLDTSTAISDSSADMKQAIAQSKGLDVGGVQSDILGKIGDFVDKAGLVTSQIIDTTSLQANDVLTKFDTAREDIFFRQEDMEATVDFLEGHDTWGEELLSNLGLGGLTQS